MAKGDLIRVPGYSQRVIYNGNIEYRNFSDNLVGNQSIINIDNNNTESSSLFTMGNFVVTTSSGNRSEYSFRGKNFTQFYDLTSLNFTNDVEKLLATNTNIKLNLDNAKLSSYAYFGSATEFIRVTLENIITYWPASLYLNPLMTTIYGDFTGYTVENYTYDAFNDKSSLNVNVTMIDNKFELVFTQDGNTIDTFNVDNKLRNVTLNYNDYVILYNNIEYPILNFTGSTNEISGYLNMIVEGDPFKDSSTTATTRTAKFHIKPNKLKVDEFFNKITSFEENLLNRYTSPKYTSTFDYDAPGDNNIVYKSTKTLTWPVSDGYNIDYSTNEYVSFVSELIKIGNTSDKAASDILTRFLVSDSISNFDSLPQLDGTQEATSGQKVTKMLKIYGRNFDEVKIWMDGLKLFNTVTYDKKNNTPDQLVKNLAKNMGWEMTTPLSDNNLLSHYVETHASTYSGQSTGLSAQQAEIEMWRRLIINSAWLFKSKGSRKSIEFFFKFLGIPKGLIDLNEYIYKAKNKIDMDIFYKILERFDLDTDLTLYNVDNDGYPKFPAQNSDMFFQKSGLWYRQTGGAGTSDHILTGNNPHIGPYDGGQTYLMQLHNLIPNFTPFTIVNEVTVTGSTNLFYNYNKGKFNYYSGNTFIDVLDSRGVNKSECVQTTTTIIPDPYPNYKETICGCPCEVEDDILSVCLKKKIVKNTTSSCDTGIESYDYNPEGYPYIYVYNKKNYDMNNNFVNGTTPTVFRSKECCIKDGGFPYLHDYYFLSNSSGIDGRIYYYTGFANTGYVCTKSPGESSDFKKQGGGCYIACQWRIANTSQDGTKFVKLNNATVTLDDITWTYKNEKYLKFVTAKNSWGMVKTDGTYFSGEPEYKYTNEADSCFCDYGISSPALVVDPVTGKKAYGCKVFKEFLTLPLTPGKVITTPGFPDYIEESPFISSMKTLYKKSVGSLGCLSSSIIRYVRY
jgi:hypothetical protein